MEQGVVGRERGRERGKGDMLLSVIPQEGERGKESVQAWIRKFKKKIKFKVKVSSDNFWAKSNLVSWTETFALKNL